jgi:hypothetical protein
MIRKYYDIEGLQEGGYPGEGESLEPDFTCQDLDEFNYKDLEKWIKENVLWGLIDEKAGGIIGYIHHEHMNKISNKLNKKALFTEEDMKDLLEFIIQDYETNIFDKNDLKYKPDEDLCWKLAGTSQNYSSREMIKIYLQSIRDNKL